MMENNSKVKHIVENILKVDKIIGLLLIIGLLSLSLFYIFFTINSFGLLLIWLGIPIGILFLYNRNLIQKDINSGLRMHIILLIITLGILIIITIEIFLPAVGHLLGFLMILSITYPLFLPLYYLLFRSIKRSLGYYKTMINEVNNQIN